MKNSYSSDGEDVLKDFYIPVLSKSVEYRRLTGFFSSSSLAVAAKGVVNLINNQGKMKLISSAYLSRKDIKSIKMGIETPDKVIAEYMLKELEDIEKKIIRNHIKALAWLIAEKRLELKIAVTKDESGYPLTFDKVIETGMFHEKVGIFIDKKGNRLSFSGSVNETANAWLYNVEEFKVFREWQDLEKEYFDFDLKRFNKFWKNKGKKVEVVDVPEAVKNKLIKMKPDNFIKIKKSLINETPENDSSIKLFEHQKEAINNWFNNNCLGLFQMATGTGKTIAALGLLSKLLQSKKNLLIIISCPYNHLINQWDREIKKFNSDLKEVYKIIADGTNPSWRNQLVDSLIDLSLGNKQKLIVFSTHRTLSSEDFMNIIKENATGLKSLLIADEVHGVGAEISKRGLLEIYDYRLGLSATPKRWFDTKGSEKLYSYFDGVVFKFGLEKALREINPLTGKTYLTPYKYIPKFISLSDEEIDDYFSTTKSLIRRYTYTKNKEKKDEIFEMLLFKRANIVKNSQAKFNVLIEILDKLSNDIMGTIIYCSPQQIKRVMRILNEKNIVCHKFTMEEGTKSTSKYYGKSERDHLIELFGKGEYKVLVAMKCLDEGVDIPPAKNAILMASSGNPREYVQRIGRVIRRSSLKKEAKIFDIIVKPSQKNLPNKLKELENKIFYKEIKRYKEIANIAKNNVDAFQILNKVEDEYEWKY